MNKSQFYLVIHSFVYFKILKTNYLFFNTITKKYIKGKNNSIISFLKTECYTLPKHDNIYYYKKTEKFDEDVHLFLNMIEDLNMGIILDSELTKKSPIVVSSDINIKLESMLKYSDEFRRENLLKLNLFINTFKNEDIDNYYENAYKQFLFPHSYIKGSPELSFKDIITFTKNAQFSNLKNLNLIFCNLSDILDYYGLFKHFKDVKVCIYLIAEDTIKNIDNLKKLHFEFPDLEFKVLITIKAQESQKIIENIELISENLAGRSTTFELIIENDRGFDILTDEILSKYPELNYSIKPFYNGNNYNFFNKNIFYSESDILESVDTMRETLARTKLNSLDFGQLNVLPDGKILTNTNFKPIGNIYTNNLDEALYAAHFDESTTWFLKRSDITPCKDCLYCDLCPSIGNYEFVFNKYNLCKL